MPPNHPGDGDDFVKPAPRRAQTFRYLYEKPTPPIVEEFVKKYNPNTALLVAKKVRSLLEKKLTPRSKLPTTEGVQAFVKERAKDKDSLTEKLKMWHEEKPFTSTDQIEKEIKDLAGVRVILYIPSRSQYDKVGEIIREIFGAENVVKHIPRKRAQDPKEPRTYQPIHLGYQGEHYWVSLRNVPADHKYQYQTGDRVEIQVTSALGNAWAEAQHDVLYKSNNYGPASLQEQQIFDAVNGLVLSSDLLLQQAHDLLMRRTFAKIEDAYELESFLKGLDVLQSTEVAKVSDLRDLLSRDHTEMILNLLRKKGKNNPLAIREIVKSLGYPNQPLLDEIIAKFKPKFEAAPTMSIVVCIASILLEDESDYEDLRTSGEKTAVLALDELAGCDKCRIMVNALTLLQDILGHEQDRVRDYLLDKVKLEDEVKTSLDWVLKDPAPRYLLEKTLEEKDHKLIGKKIPSGWTWFKRQAEDPESICGLAFKLAAIGATKPFELQFLIKAKDIGELSRSSTERDAEDEEQSDSEVEN